MGYLYGKYLAQKEKDKKEALNPKAKGQEGTTESVSNFSFLIIFF